LPASFAERQLWSIWIGYLVASCVVILAGQVIATPDRPLDETTLFPVWATLSGLAFFALGGGYWGRCYAIGALFFVSALVMPFCLRWSALIFGGVWMVALGLVGVHLRGLGIEEQRRHAPSAPGKGSS
jgi:hypothetical protein